jgi:hypothetical protein
MITQINKDVKNAVAFKASGKVQQIDFQQLIILAVEDLVSRTGQLNFLLYLDTTIENFTSSAWLKEVTLGMKNLTKWNRAAIVTDASNVIKFTNGFRYIMPGEFSGFEKEELNEALLWVSK